MVSAKVPVVVASALVPVLGVVPLAVVMVAVVVVLVVDVVPAVVPVLLVFAIAVLVVPDEAAAAAVGAEPTPANDITANIAHSCFVRVFMD